MTYNPISKWAEQVMDRQDAREFMQFYHVAAPDTTRDIAATAWALLYLTDPTKSGSQEMLNMIIKRRKQLQEQERTR